MSSNKLPSQFQIGDAVVLPATIVGVSFAEGKVEYTVLLDERTTILVDSLSVGGLAIREGATLESLNSRDFRIVAPAADAAAAKD